MTQTSPVTMARGRWGRLAADLLPPSPVPVVGVRSVTATALVAVAGTALLMARQPSALDNVYSEDGGIFLPQALELPVVETLTRPYAGYLHVAPRMLTELVAPLPLGDAATGFAVVSAAAVTGLALLVYLATAGHFESRRVRAVLASAIVLLPMAQGELLVNLANLHWLMVVVAFWLLLWRPATTWELVIGSTVVFLAALSDPMVALFLPLAAVRVVARPEWRQHLITASFTVGILIQTAVLLRERDNRLLIGSTAPEHLSVSINPVRTGVHYAGYVVGDLAGGRRWSGQTLEGLGFGWNLLGMLALALVLLLVLRRRREIDLPLIAVTLLASLALFAVGESSAAGTFPERYTIAPALLLLGAVALALDGSPVSPTWLVASRRAVLIAIVLVWAVNFRVETFRDRSPSWGDELVAARARCLSGNQLEQVIPIALPAITTTLPCDRIRPGSAGATG